MMHRCRACQTKITTYREHQPPEARPGGGFTPGRPATWIHLEDGHDDHIPAPPNQDPTTGMPRKAKKAPSSDPTLLPDGPTP